MKTTKEKLIFQKYKLEINLKQATLSISDKIFAVVDSSNLIPNVNISDIDWASIKIMGKIITTENNLIWEKKITINKILPPYSLKNRIEKQLFYENIIEQILRKETNQSTADIILAMILLGFIANTNYLNVNLILNGHFRNEPTKY